MDMLCMLEEGSKDGKNHNNSALGRNPCSIFLPCVWCALLLCKAFPWRKRSSLNPWRATFTASPLTDVGARHADGCTHINTHASIRASCQMGSVLSSATPRGKPAMTSPRGVQVQGRDRKWFTGSLVRQILPCHWQAVGLKGEGVWVTPRSWVGRGPSVVDRSLRKQASLISPCNQVDEAFFQNSRRVGKKSSHSTISVTETASF